MPSVSKAYYRADPSARQMSGTLVWPSGRRHASTAQGCSGRGSWQTRRATGCARIGVRRRMRSARRRGNGRLTPTVWALAGLEQDGHGAGAAPRRRSGVHSREMRRQGSQAFGRDASLCRLLREHDRLTPQGELEPVAEGARGKFLQQAVQARCGGLTPQRASRCGTGM